MKTFEVTIWRYPEETREENAVGISVFYFTERAETENEAIEKAKEKFNNAVYDSLVTEI